MLAQEVAAPFDDPDFLFEIKWDGYRALLECDGEGHAHLWSRTARDLGRDLPALSLALGEETTVPLLLDGEIVALQDGRSDFERLLRHAEPIVYVAFDLLGLRRSSFLALPLRERRARLVDKVRPSSRLILYEGVVGAGISFFKGVQSLGLEGMMAKDLHSPYRPGKRSSTWRKVLNLRDGVFPVLALELGETGTVQALWIHANARSAEPIARVSGVPLPERTMLAKLAGPGLPDLAGIRSERPLARPPEGLYCRVRYRKIASGGKLRHPVYVGLVTGDRTLPGTDGQHGDPESRPEGLSSDREDREDREVSPP